MIQRIKYIGLTFVALIALGLVFPSIVLAQSGSIGGRPANPDPSNTRTQSIFVKTIRPGDTTNDAVEVVNNTGTTKIISVYSVDSVPSSGGAFACAQSVDKPVSVGKWITMTQTSVELAANEKMNVTFSLAVPSDAEPGEHNGCIVLQEDKEPTFQGGIGLSFRTAIRVAVLVPGEIKKELSAVGIATSTKNDKLTITPQVKNTGNVSLDTKVHVSLESFLGTAARQINTYPVLRQQATEWNFEFDKPFWGGFYTATYSLTYDSNTKAFLQEATTSGAQHKTIDGPRALTFIMPHPLALLLEVALITGVILSVLSYMRRKKQLYAIENDWQTYTVKRSEQLPDIAKHYETSWKKLAAANGLKAPYHLKPGQKIKTPIKPSKRSTKPLKKS